jgi:chaperone required for assembly of F1-ATPase
VSNKPDNLSDGRPTESGSATRAGTATVHAGGPRISAEAVKRELPAKFFKTAEAKAGEDGVRVTLDGRGLKTPKKADLVVPTLALGDAIAAEWNALEDKIDPERLPLTKIANTVIDGVVGMERELHEDLVRFIGNDLLFYRAGSPRELDERQAAAWDPVLAWVGERFGAQFKVTEGVMPVEQNLLSVAKVAGALSEADAMKLAPVHVMTTLTGSALSVIAYLEGRLMADEVWAHTHVDEGWQEEQWGEDAEALERRAKRRAEFDAAVRFLELTGA